MPHLDGPEPPGGLVSAGAASGRAGAVPLARLLSVAVLTPAQACLVAAQLLQAAHRRAAPGDGQPAADRLGPITLTPAGEVEVGRPVLDPGTPVDEPLEQLVRNARRLPAHPKPEQVALLRRLEEAAGDPSLEPGVRAHVLLAALTDTLGTGARERLGRQLAALVDAFAQLAGGARPGPPDVPRQVGPADAPEATAPLSVTPKAQTVSVPARPATHRAPAGQGPPRAPRRGGPLRKPRGRARRVGMVALIVLAVLVAGGYAVLRSTGTDVIDALGLGSQPAAPGSTAPATPSKHPAKHAQARDRSAVPRLAARHAGVVTGVAVQKTGSCRPGALCPVRVTVRMRPATTARTL
ncbi:MAG: hypothetical protein ACTHOK_03375, partial [Nocardioidaceae bacterium]